MGSSSVTQGDQLCALRHLEGWDKEHGRETQEGGDMGIYVCIWLIHFVVQQKLTQYCEAIISNKVLLKKIIITEWLNIY